MRSTLAVVLAALCGLGAAHAEGIGPAIQAQHWARAEAAAAALPDPLAGRLVRFFRLLAPRGGSLAELDDFRVQYPDWPQQAALQRRREEALAAEPDDAAVLESCARERPRGAAGLARWAEALSRQALPKSQPDSQPQSQLGAAADAARAAWEEVPAEAGAEAEFLRRWGPSLRPADHWRRFDRLAWSDPAAAARVLPLLDPSDRARAEARLALRRDDPRAAALLAALLGALPAPEQADPTLVLEEARWLRRARRDTEARDLLLRDGLAIERALPDARRPAVWAERDLIARRRLRDHDPEGAYALVAETGQTAPEAAGDAAFLAGWLALRRLLRPDAARQHFQALQALSSAAVSRGRAHYWLARTADALGDKATAATEDRAGAAWATTYYGQLAALAGGETAEALAARIGALRDPPWTPTDAADLLAGDLARAAVLLTAWGEPGRAASFLQRLAELATQPADQALVGRLALRLGLPQTAVALARRAGRLGAVLPESGWPLAAPLPPDAPGEPAAILAVIRQESSFDAGTVSPAGARGLLQLMPQTAAATGRALGLEVTEAALTADPALNVRLGAAYLGELRRRFDGALPLALAAYNAGPSRVAEWLAANGDPRAGGEAAMIDWIELVPLAETRNYVQRVLENVTVYRARLGTVSAGPTVARSPA